MSTTAIGSTADIGATIRDLVTRIDANGDGQISVGEFQSFLTKLAAQVQQPASPDTTAAAATGDAPYGTSPLIDPSSWTDNNAPYGVTLAGFSPQDHTNLSVPDLSNLQNAKYAVYDYLLTNKITPDGTWAQNAADALNKQLGTTVFHAIDGETLGYGDEYVHSASNGYGMQSGTYNPNATGEFFWGVA